MTEAPARPAVRPGVVLLAVLALGVNLRAALSAYPPLLERIRADLVPVLPVLGPWPWVVLASVAVGAGFPLGLAVVAWRTPDGATAASVSALTLGSAYLLAGVAPLLMGVLIDLAGFRAALLVIAAAVVAQAVVIVPLGPRRVTYEGPREGTLPSL